MLAQIAQRHAKMELVPKWLQGVLASENCRFSQQDGKPLTVAHSCEITHSHGLLTHFVHLLPGGQGVLCERR